MPDFRAYAAPSSDEPTEIVLDADESHHLVTVNRARAGDPVTVFNGQGQEWECELGEALKRGARLRVKRLRQPVRLPFEVTLIQSLPKGATMDTIVREATEIGARRIFPVISERSQVQLEQDRSDRKVEKWRTTALEACKQCGNPWLPDIAPVTSLAEQLTPLATDAVGLVAALTAGTRTIRQALASAARGTAPRVTVMIGPEGDFSPEEVEAAQRCGFLPISLGPLVLRCDTAAAYALSVISHELQHWDR